MKIKVENQVRTAIRQRAHYIYMQFGKQARKDFRENIGSIFELLRDNPQLGSVEPLLAGLKRTYRSIVIHRLNKLVYFVEDDIIYIVDFWDTRREPKNQAEHLS